MKTRSSTKGNDVMTMTEEVMAGIKTFIGEHPAERGGLLGTDSPGTITHFAPDPTARCNAGAYDPDIAAMNRQIKAWKKEGIVFCGFAHSHPKNVTRLSAYDEWYAGEILATFTKLDRLYLPIVMTVPDNAAFEILPYFATPGTTDRKRVNITAAELKITEMGVIPQADLNDVPTTTATTSDGANDTAEGGQRSKGSSVRYFGNFSASFDAAENEDGDHWKSLAFHQSEFDADQAARRTADRYLERIKGAFDLERLDRVRAIVIGTGGGQSLLRNMARMGIGEFVLIDHDHVSESNVASQQARPSAIGKPKVIGLAEDVVELNPAAAVLAIPERIEDITDEQFDAFIRRRMRVEFGYFARARGHRPVPYQPQCVVLLALTDNFWAQGRGHRLGLQLGLPTICAQEYKDGVGGEITYTVPGVTQACHRCITASRYKAYLEEGFTNDVTSQGAPIFAAEYLNAVIGHIVLAVVHHGTKQSLWGNVVQRLGNKNLVRLRMHPDFDLRFGNTFAKRHEGAAEQASLFMLDTLFLPQTPDCGQSEARPICPDCKGTGNLLNAVGTFDDTRKMRLKQALT